jgi:hypothetical protein
MDIGNIELGAYRQLFNQKLEVEVAGSKTATGSTAVRRGRWAGRFPPRWAFALPILSATSICDRPMVVT